MRCDLWYTWLSDCLITKSSQAIGFSLSQIVKIVQDSGWVLALQHGLMRGIDWERAPEETGRLPGSGVDEAKTLNNLA